MRILRPVVETLVPPVLDRGHHVCLCGAVAGQLVRDHDTRGPALLFQQLAEQALGGLFAALWSKCTKGARCVPQTVGLMLIAQDHVVLARATLARGQRIRRYVYRAASPVGGS